MRIGIVCPYSFDVPGGVQFHVRDLAEYFIAQGHFVSVLAPANDETADLPPYVVTCGRAVPVRYNGSVARLTFGPVTGARVAKWLENGGFDVLPGGGFHLGGGKNTRRKLRVGNAAPLLFDDRSGDVGVAVAIQHGRVCDGTGSDHARDIAVHQATLRNPNLLANGNLVPGRNETRDVRLCRVMGNAGQRDTLPLAHFPAGQGDIEQSGGRPGVVFERLVEVPDAEEQDGVRKALFDLEILTPHRRDIAIAGRLAPGTFPLGKRCGCV